MVLAAALVLSAGIALGVKKTNLNRTPWTENIEALCNSEDNNCLKGGPGETSCSITSSDGLGFTCCTSCTGSYACCGASGCNCV